MRTTEELRQSIKSNFDKLYNNFIELDNVLKKCKEKQNEYTNRLNIAEKGIDLLLDQAAFNCEHTDSKISVKSETKEKLNECAKKIKQISERNKTLFVGV